MNLPMQFEPSGPKLSHKVPTAKSTDEKKAARARARLARLARRAKLLEKKPFEKPKSPTMKAQQMNTAGENALLRLQAYKKDREKQLERKEERRVRRKRKLYWLWLDKHPNATGQEKNQKKIELDIFQEGVGERKDYIKDDKKPAAVKDDTYYWHDLRLKY